MNTFMYQFGCLSIRINVQRTFTKGDIVPTTQHANHTHTHTNTQYTELHIPQTSLPQLYRAAAAMASTNGINDFQRTKSFLISFKLK